MATCSAYDRDCHGCLTAAALNQTCFYCPAEETCSTQSRDGSQRPCFADRCNCIEWGSGKGLAGMATPCLTCLAAGCEFCGAFMSDGACSAINGTPANTEYPVCDAAHIVRPDGGACPLLYQPHEWPPSDFSWPEEATQAIVAAVIILVLTAIRLIIGCVCRRRASLTPQVTHLEGDEVLVHPNSRCRRLVQPVTLFLAMLASLVMKLIALGVDRWERESTLERDWGLTAVTYDDYGRFGWVTICQSIAANSQAQQHQAAMCNIGVVGIAFTLMFLILSTVCSFSLVVTFIGSKIRPTDKRFRLGQLLHLSELAAAFHTPCAPLWRFVSVRALLPLTWSKRDWGLSYRVMLANLGFDYLVFWLFLMSVYNCECDTTGTQRDPDLEMAAFEDQEPDLPLGPDLRFIDPFGPLFPSEIPAGGIRGEEATEEVQMEEAVVVLPAQEHHHQQHLQQQGEPSPDSNVPTEDTLESDLRASLIVPNGGKRAASSDGSSSAAADAGYQPPGAWSYQSVAVGPAPAADEFAQPREPAAPSASASELEKHASKLQEEDADTARLRADNDSR